MCKVYSKDGIKRLEETDIKILFTWPKKYGDEDLQFHRILEKGCEDEYIVFGQKGLTTNNLCFPWSQKDMLRTLKSAHGFDIEKALGYGMLDADGSPFYPDWMLWKYYQKNVDDMVEKLGFQNIFTSFQELKRAMAARPRSLTHPTPADFQQPNSKLMAQGNLIPPITIAIPERKVKKKKGKEEESMEKHDHPEPPQKAKRQKLDKTPLTLPEAKPAPPPPATTVVEGNRRYPTRIALSVFSRLRNWKKPNADDPETYDTLAKKYGKILETAPPLAFILDDEPLSDENQLRFMLLLISLEARFYAETPERLNAIQHIREPGVRAREFPPFTFEMIEQPVEPPTPYFVQPDCRIKTLKTAELRKATEERNRIFEEGKAAAKAAIDAYDAYRKLQKPKWKLFKNGLTYDQVAEGIVENPSWYVDVINKCWAKRSFSNDDLKRGAKEFDNFNMLCLRYWEARRLRDKPSSAAKKVEEPAEEFIAPDDEDN